MSLADFTAPETATVRVLIADDHQLVREMVGAFLGTQPDIDVGVVGSYDDARVALASGAPYDLLLLDVQMPGMDGILKIDSLVSDYPDTAVIIFSGVASDEYVQEALRVGARGFIPKTLPFKSLVNTIRLIASGESFVPSSFVTKEKVENLSGRVGLSEEELAVLRMVCAGMSNKEIAREMSKTEVLIKMHMRSICKRLNAKNRTQAAMIAIRERIV